MIGASLAGLSAARALRRQGFDGALTIVGAEAHRPYDRPPLSKEFLAGDICEADLSSSLMTTISTHVGCWESTRPGWIPAAVSWC